MNRLLPLTFALAWVLSIPITPALAQVPDDLPPPPAPPPSNEEVGVSIDRFIGDASRSPSRVSHDVLFTRTILRRGDPLQTGDPGAVLRYHNEVALATLPQRNATPLTRLPEQIIVVVQSGEGRVDDGASWWELRPGIAVLVPPETDHRFTNTGDEPLQMLMLSRDLEPEVNRRTGVLVRDIDALVLTERNVHWSNMAKYVFSGAHPDDGLHWGDRVYIVYMGPMTIARPHAHMPAHEEVWVKLTEGDAFMQLGSEIRRWPVNVGFLVPPTGQTVHAALNTSDEIQAWFYFSRLDASDSPPDPDEVRPPANPVIAEALERATLPGRPLDGQSSP